MTPNVFKRGDRIVTRFGSHYVVDSSEIDEDGHEWVTYTRPDDGEERTAHVTDLRPYVEDFHGEWKGQQ